MNKIYFEVGDNVVIKHTPIPEIGENMYKTEIVMTKEIFQECYKKWIEPQGEMFLTDKNDIDCQCPECGFIYKFAYAYCPNCGAKMKIKDKE